jgi:adenosylhomocysteinase
LFLEALSKQANVSAIIPKRKSIDPQARAEIEKSYSIIDVTREELSDFATARTLFKKYSNGTETVLLDIGGYFSPVIHHLVLADLPAGLAFRAR